MNPLLTAAILVLALAGPVAAQEWPASDPVLGERLVQGAATRQNLWIRNDKGAVVAFDRQTGERRVLSESGIVDLLRANGRTIGLKSAADSSHLTIVDLETGAALAPPVEATYGSLLQSHRGWIILSPDAVFEAVGGGWRRRPIHDETRHFGVMTASATPDGSIYVGYNQGEWGGGLWRIAPDANKLEQVQRVDGDVPCDGPLNAVCQPVTGIISDSSSKDCVLVSTGLSHFFSKGGVLRVCGEQIDMVFEDFIPLPPNALGAGISKWPMYGLASVKDGWIAVSQGKTFLEHNGSVEAKDFPTIRDWHGLGLAETDDFLILRTDVNWGMSLSGYTPLLIPIGN